MREQQTSEGLLLTDKLHCDCGWVGQTPCEVIQDWHDKYSGERLVEFTCPECAEQNEELVYDEAGR